MVHSETGYDLPSNNKSSGYLGLVDKSHKKETEVQRTMGMDSVTD